jgi:hypothetical protein
VYRENKLAQLTVPIFLLHERNPVSIQIQEIVLLQPVGKHFVPAGRGLLQSVDELQTFEGLTFWESVLTRKIQVNLIGTRSTEKRAFDVELIQGQPLIGCQGAHGEDTTELGCGGKCVSV